MIRIHAYTYKIHSVEQIGPKRVQLQLTQSYCLELAQNCEVWNISQIGHIKMNIEKLKRGVSRGREEVFLLVHVNTTILQWSLSRCTLRKGASTPLGMNSPPFLHYFSLIISIIFSHSFSLFFLLHSPSMLPPFGDISAFEIEWVYYPFCFCVDFSSPMSAYSCWLSFSLFWITTTNEFFGFFFFFFFFFFVCVFTVKTWFLSSVNGGRPLKLFGLVWTNPMTCTSW